MTTENNTAPSGLTELLAKIDANIFDLRHFEEAAGKLNKMTMAALFNETVATLREARAFLAPKAAEQALPVEGLGRMTDEDDGFITLQFVDEAAAQRFMRAYAPTVEDADMPPPAAEQAPVADAARPTDDALWDQTLQERDHYHDMADKLSAAIAAHLGVDIGEHSNANCPWDEALEAIENAPTQQPARASEAAWPTYEEVIATYQDIRAQAHKNPIGFIEADELEKLGDPEFGAAGESHVRLWHAANPPSRALIPVYGAPLAAPAQQAITLTDDARERVRDAIVEALGEAYDCLRTWAAWSIGTMGPDDFMLVAEDGERVCEITDAVFAALQSHSEGDAS